MGIKRALGDFKELRESVVQLFDDDRSAEAEASLRITKSAQRFTKNTKEVVDDKLSFSATLMRAGEVQAANRLLAEVEHDVREEEAALMESVNEVKVAQSLRHTRVTRLRLARMLAVAALGSAVLSFSAAGMAVAGFLRDRAEAISRPSDEGLSRVAATGSRADRRQVALASMHRLRIGDVDLLLTKSQYARLKELAGNGSSSYDELEELLNALPDPLADRIKEAMTVAQGEVAETEGDADALLAQVDKDAPRKKRAAKKAAAETQEETKQETEEPTPEPSPSDDNNESNQKEDGDSSSEEEEGDTGPPVPIKP